MIKKISRRLFLEEYPDFPVISHYRNTYLFPEIYNSYILYVGARSVIGLSKNVSVELADILKLMGYQQIFFLGDSKSPWLYTDHYYKPVKQSLDYLIQHKLSKSFNGAIKVDAVDLKVFLRHIFWLVRCNGVVFMPHFSDVGFNVIINICQYGNIHLSTLNEKVDELFKAAILNSKLIFLNEKTCISFKIPHRLSSNT